MTGWELTLSVGGLASSCRQPVRAQAFLPSSFKQVIEATRNKKPSAPPSVVRDNQADRNARLNALVGQLLDTICEIRRSVHGLLDAKLLLVPDGHRRRQLADREHRRAVRQHQGGP